MKIVAVEDLDWGSIVRPGDTIVWGQACGEPQTLAESLLARRTEIGGRFGVFLGTCYGKALKREHADIIDFSGFVGTAGARPLSRHGLLDVLPVQYSRLERLLIRGAIPCDVAFVQLSPPDAQGRMSPGVLNDYIRAAMDRARVVVAEINTQVPWTPCDDPLTAADIDIAIETDRPLVAIAPPAIGDVERAIARHAGAFVSDRAVIQSGLGAIPEAVLEGLKDRRDLGVHAGMISDAIADLMACGAVTNAYKEHEAGVTIAGTLVGSERLFRFVDRNPAIRLVRPSITHDVCRIAKLSRYVSINSALEVDLTGQVNSEAIGDDYVGTIGGQIDFVRGATMSPGGRSIIALASTTPDGGASRIVAPLSGPVSTLRSDVDVIVTEWGAAELAAKTLRQRVAAMIAIAHPKFREDLARAAHGVMRRA